MLWRSKEVVMMVTITYLEDRPRRTADGILLATVIKCREFGDKELSGWKGKINYKWKVGDRVDIAVKKKKSKDKKRDFYNYKVVDSIQAEFRSQESVVSIEETAKKYIDLLGLTVEELLQLGILLARILTLKDKKRMFSGMGWLTKKPIHELLAYSK
jgi:hypothetical protein